MKDKLILDCLLIIGIHFHSNIDLTSSCILILIDLRQTYNQAEPSPVDCSWLKERLESICTSKSLQRLMIGSVLAQYVGRVSLKALCDSSLIGLLHSLGAVKC